VAPPLAPEVAENAEYLRNLPESVAQDMDASPASPTEDDCRKRKKTSQVRLWKQKFRF